MWQDGGGQLGHEWLGRGSAGGLPNLCWKHKPKKPALIKGEAQRNQVIKQLLINRPKGNHMKGFFWCSSLPPAGAPNSGRGATTSLLICRRHAILGSGGCGNCRGNDDSPSWQKQSSSYLHTDGERVEAAAGRYKCRNVVEGVAYTWSYVF